MFGSKDDHEDLHARSPTRPIRQSGSRTPAHSDYCVIWCLQETPSRLHSGVLLLQARENANDASHGTQKLQTNRTPHRYAVSPSGSWSANSIPCSMHAKVQASPHENILRYGNAVVSKSEMAYGLTKHRSAGPKSAKRWKVRYLWNGGP